MKLWEALVELAEVTFEKSGGNYHHHADIHGHKVWVTAQDHGLQDGHYNVDFAVNGSTSHHMGSQDPHVSRKIMHHVAHAVHSFVRDHKPKAVHMIGSDFSKDKQKQKDRVYHAFAHRIARKHGGKVIDTPFGGSVHFK